MTDNGTRRLTPWFLFGQALGTFRARWKRVLGVGAVVTAFTVTAGTLLDLMFENKEAQNDGKIALGFALASVALERGERIRHDLPFGRAGSHCR